LTGVIAIDESGDLGPDGSRYFAMTVIMIRRARDLKKSYDCLMRDAKGHRFYDTKDNVSSVKVLEAVASSDVRIIYEVVDKNSENPNGSMETTSMSKPSLKSSNRQWSSRPATASGLP